MSAAGVSYSRHKLLKSIDLQRLKLLFANAARRELEGETAIQHHLDRIQSLAILSLYEFAAGSGFQAWYDVSK
jgi:hypothetical protein